MVFDLDVYAKAYAAPGGMKAGFEVYRAFDQGAQDNADLLAKAGKLHMPLLFVAGQESFLSTSAEEIVSEISDNGALAVIPNSGHYPPEGNPGAFADAVIGFCQKNHSLL